MPTAGQVASLTSTNNFINFCATTNLPITNGLQIKTGSCNPAPMGQIPAQALMPASKFQFPENFGTLQENQSFTINMAINNLEAGNFVNAQANYYAAPQQLNAQGVIIGHTHFVIEPLQSLTQTTPLDNTKFAFFQGVNTAAVNGVVSVTVASGLPVGIYKLSSINAAANHQPVLAPVAQHGSLDDVIYFSVTADGKAAAGSGAAAGAAASTAANATATAAATANSVAASNATAVASAVSAASNATATAAAASDKGAAAGSAQNAGAGKGAASAADASATAASGAKATAASSNAKATAASADASATAAASAATGAADAAATAAAGKDQSSKSKGGRSGRRSSRRQIAFGRQH